MTIIRLRSFAGSLFTAGIVSLGVLASVSSHAGPWVTTGDSSLRSDIQILADGGRILSPTMMWPMAWGDIMAALDERGDDWTPEETAALIRVKKRMQFETRTGSLRLKAHASIAENPVDIRSFEDTPREKGEVGIGFEYTGDWWATSVQGQWIRDPQDGDEWRADDSYIGVALGNWMLSASITDRWWGPGWQSSLILSNNARPIPAFMLERNLTTPFKTKWLRWMGRWDLTVMYGFLEKERAAPNAHFFAMRLDFRPIKRFQIGFSRTAMWCGDGNPCGFDAFMDVLFRGDSGSSNPNQLGGVDLRWSDKAWGQPYSLYMQWIGEDENNFYATEWLILTGGELTGFSERLGTWRTFLEWSDTECDFRFYRSIRGDSGPGKPGCAYNHPAYATGYRYKDRAIGHSFDGDSSVFTLGGMLTGHQDNAWYATFAIGNLNRRNARPSTTAENKTRYRDLNLVHRRMFWVGQLDLGVGYDYRKDTVTGAKIEDFKAFAEFSVRTN
ncbi:MAG: capsule assembly Wzi family protein [Gammaproteobacteria bacterium]|nr:capsule assembly Wzi family protein [Gammaproteobacteria bacterium]